MALADVLEKIPAGVTLVAAIKYAPHPESVAALIRSGVHAMGENQVQDAEVRLAALDAFKPPLPPFEKHFIGTIQSNKIGKIVRLFDVVQSLDDLEHAEKLDRAAGKELRFQNGQGRLRVLVQINAGCEKQKNGLAPDHEKVAAFMASLRRFSHLKIEGLMVVVPLEGDSRPYFKTAKTLFDSLKADFGLTLLSMGTSDDFEIAIEQGATMVRVGRVLFE